MGARRLDCKRRTTDGNRLDLGRLLRSDPATRIALVYAIAGFPRRIRHLPANAIRLVWAAPPALLGGGMSLTGLAVRL